MNIRGRILAIRAALRSHAQRARMGQRDESLPDFLEGLATELGDVAVELLALELDGPAADGPGEIEAQEAEFDVAETQPITPIGQRRRAGEPPDRR